MNGKTKSTGRDGGAPPAPSGSENAPLRGASEDTRTRLLNAALDAFGRYGFDGASTRMIAREAGVNLAAIPYHFGGKEGLHKAVAQHIVEEVAGRLGPLVDTVSAALDQGMVGPEEAGTMLQTMIGQAAETILGHPEAKRWAPFILREQMDPSPAFEVLYEGFMGRAHMLATRLLACATGGSPDDPEVIARTFAVLGQLVVFRLASALVERRLGWREYGPDEIEIVGRILHDNTEAIVRAGRRT